MPGAFVVFLRDSIKRVIVIGMRLPRVALINDAGELDAICKTHTVIQLWVGFRSIRFTFITILGTVTHSPGRKLIGAYVWRVVSSGKQIDRITHRCKIFTENYKKMASRDDQEICGGVLKDLVKMARHTTKLGMTSIFRGIYNDEQCQCEPSPTLQCCANLPLHQS